MPALIPTTVVGSYPQPAWLIDRDRMAHETPPRIREQGLWRVAEPWLVDAQDDASRLAIRDMELAGIDIISDGEIRRESYSNVFATALEGIDPDNPGSVPGRGGGPTPVPRVVGPLRRTRPVLLHSVELLRASTDRQIKITVPGPFTLSQQAQNDYYPDVRAMALDFAVAVNAELRDLQAAGVDVIQLDEPWVQSRVPQAREFAIEVIDRALAGITCTTALHMCFGYAYIAQSKPNQYGFLSELNDCPVQQISVEAAQPHLDLTGLAELSSKTIILGVLDLGDPIVESPDTVAARIRAALPYVPAERLIAAPDCGMKYLPRDVAFGKLTALTSGAAIVRAELG